jgi:hypothetical protein
MRQAPGHAALRTIARPITPHFGMHGAGVFGTRLCLFSRGLLRVRVIGVTSARPVPVLLGRCDLLTQKLRPAVLAAEVELLQLALG